MTKLLSAAAGATVIVLAFVLNPSAERHRTKIRAVISERSVISKALAVVNSPRWCRPIRRSASPRTPP